MTDKEFDDGLKAVMGDRFHGETETDAIVREHAAKRRTAESSGTCKNTPKEEKPVDASWEPVKHSRDFMDRLKQTAKDVCLYAVLSLILFYWQQTGRLETNTSWYALLVCVGMVFFSICKNCRGGVK